MWKLHWMFSTCYCENIVDEQLALSGVQCIRSSCQFNLPVFCFVKYTVPLYYIVYTYTSNHHHPYIYST